MRKRRLPSNILTPETSPISLVSPKPETPEFLTFGKPDIGPAEIDAVSAVLRSGWLSTGPVVQEFQKEFERFMGSGYAIAVSSCTEALMISLLVSNVGEGWEVLVPPMTFCATVNAIIQIGAKPVFIDVTPSGHLNPDLIQHHVTPKTRAIIPVHYAGAACRMDEIMKEARKYGLTVIEDAAHSIGGEYVEPMSGNDPGRRTKQGAIGDLGCFSFYATKNITSAEGGMVLTKDPEKAARIKQWCMQGLTVGAWKRYGSGPLQRYEVNFPGHKGNMSDVHAAIGLSQLRRWPALKARRDAVWNVYEDAFGLKEPGHSKHLFTIRHPRRDQLREFLFARGIGTGIHFNALHLEPGYKPLRYREGQFPIAEKIGRETLSLPISATMTADDAKRVVAAVKEFSQ